MQCSAVALREWFRSDAEGLGYHLKSGENLTLTAVVRALGPAQNDADKLGLARRGFSLGLTPCPHGRARGEVVPDRLRPLEQL